MGNNDDSLKLIGSNFEETMLIREIANNYLNELNQNKQREIQRAYENLEIAKRERYEGLPNDMAKIFVLSQTFGLDYSALWRNFVEGTYDYVAKEVETASTLHRLMVQTLIPRTAGIISSVSPELFMEYKNEMEVPAGSMVGAFAHQASLPVVFYNTGERIEPDLENQNRNEMNIFSNTRNTPIIESNNLEEAITRSINLAIDYDVGKRLGLYRFDIQGFSKRSVDKNVELRHKRIVNLILGENYEGH